MESKYGRYLINTFAARDNVERLLNVRQFDLPLFRLGLGLGWVPVLVPGRSACLPGFGLVSRVSGVVLCATLFEQICNEDLNWNEMRSNPFCFLAEVDCNLHPHERRLE